MRMMVYGDSNSWGFPPDGSGLRMAPDRRWPGVTAAALDAELVEEALPGRTTAHDDPDMLGEAMNGLRHLPVALRSNAPLDLVLIMLGTNDLKARFDATAVSIAENICRLVTALRRTGGGPGPWADSAPPAVGLIAPPPLGPQADAPNWERYAEWQGGRAKSAELGHRLRVEAQRFAPDFHAPVFDAGEVVAMSSADPIHMDEAAHRRLGQALASWIARVVNGG